jgi:acetyl-CoA C-acetyltransferase
MGISGNVAVIGCGTTKFGEHFTLDYKDLLYESVTEAVKDAKIELKDIDAGWLGTYMPYAWNFEGNSGSTVAETLNLYPIPVTRVASYCATGMEAIRNAAFAVAAGESKFALAVGVEKMRDVPSRGSLVAQHVEKGHPVLCKGRTAPGMFALLATRYFHENKVNEEILAKVAVKNHKNGSMNPRAHFRREITIEQAVKAPPVAEPLRLFDCCPTTDGSAACILTTVENAKNMKAEYLVLKGVGLATYGGYFTMQFNPDFDFLGFRATQEAAKKAYRDAGVTDPVKEIDLAECHDCFTITEIINYEDLGLAPRGQGWRLIDEGRSSLEGDMPVNTSGGLKSFGHPIGASGIRMVNEVCDQLRGRSGKRQIKDARRGLAHTLGGPGVLSCVMILEKP